MKRFFPAVVLVLAALWLVTSWLPPRTAAGDFDLAGFGKIPVLVGGRVKPLDTVARNSLLIIHGKQTVRLADGKQIGSMQWLSRYTFQRARSRQISSVRHPER